MMKKIVRGIKLALSEKFKKKLKNIINPYGDGNSSKRIIDILKKTKKNKKLMLKEITY